MIKDPAIKKILVRQCYEKKISQSALAKELGIPKAKIRQLIESYGYVLEPPKKIKKYVLKNGQSMYNYCKQNGGYKEYHRCLSLIAIKGLTPDEAINFHRQPKNPDWRERKNYWARIRYYGYTEAEARLPSNIIRKYGILKQSKYRINGTTFRDYCFKHPEINYKEITKILRAYHISVRDAMNKYKQGVTFKKFADLGYKLRNKKLKHKKFRNLNNIWGKK